MDRQTTLVLPAVVCPEGRAGYLPAWHPSDYQRLYDRLAPYYGIAQILLPMWRRYTEAVLPYLPRHGPLLEIGPGPGLLLSRLATRPALTVGLDLSAGMLAQARLCLERTGLAPNLIQAQAERLPLADGSVAALVLTFVFSALPDGRAAMVEIGRVLQPGGVVTLVDAAVPADGNPWARGLACLWARFGDTLREEAPLMVAAGLEVLEQKPLGPWGSVRLTVGRRPGG